MELIGEDGSQDAGEKDVEEIEERPDAGNCYDEPVGPGDREPVETGGDGSQSEKSEYRIQNTERVLGFLGSGFLGLGSWVLGFSGSPRNPSSREPENPRTPEPENPFCYPGQRQLRTAGMS